MMVLIDAGNTRIKVDWLEEGAPRRASRVLAFTTQEPQALQHWLSEQPARPSAAVGVNVAGPQAATFIESALKCPVQWLRPGSRELGVLNGYREPEKLGADRWAALLGLAWHERVRRNATAHGAACAMLAIFGTATTVDTLRPARVQGIDGDSPSFEFPGGLIFPGPDMMLSALSEGTANLPHARGDTALYPAHTHQAIATGVAAAQAGAVLRQWLAGLDLCGDAPEVYVSGGGWPLVRDETQRLLDVARGRLGLPTQPLHWLEAPVLDGLAQVAALST